MQFMKEEVTTNQKVQSWRAINLLESFMTIFGKKTKEYEDFRIDERGTGVLKSTQLSYKSCRQDKVYYLV